MSELQHHDQRTISQSSHGLGKNSPVWQNYLEHASKRDSALIDGWNKAMEVLLLFAALFSAVVTAFLIESYKNLQADSSESTTTSLTRIIELLDAIALGQPPPTPGIKTPSLDNFRPRKTDVVINTLWFFSLVLSISVSLIAILVKQWGEEYLKSDVFSPDYVQVRTRQARYNKLHDWKAGSVVQILPIIMHMALGFFLLGLALFLGALNLESYYPVMIAVILTLSIYLCTTILPLFFSFCPYQTPLSSRKFWGFPYFKVINAFRTPDGSNKQNKLPCEIEEQRISTNTIPDYWTAQAILWLISHSQQDSSTEAAARAIADTTAGPEFWDSLVEESFVRIIAQKFIASFNSAKDQIYSSSPTDSNAEKASLAVVCYSQVLAKVARHSTIQLIDTTDALPLRFDHTNESNILRLPLDLFILVRDKFKLLTKSNHYEIHVAGVCAESAWHTAAGRNSLNNEDTGPLLLRITCLQLKPNSPRPQLRAEMLISLMETIAVELSHMNGELTEEEVTRTLGQVICLYHLAPPRESILRGPAREAASTVLAVIAALLNNYQSMSVQEAAAIQGTKGDQFHLYESFKRSRDAYSHWQQHRYHAGSVGQPFSAYWRPWLAQWIAQICTKHPKYREDNFDTLLLLGLTGTLRSFMADPNQAEKLAELLADQSFSTIHSRPIRLPFILSSTCDIRERAAEDIYTAIFPPLYNDSLGTNSVIPAKYKAILLKELPLQGSWIKFEAPFHPLTGILQLLRESAKPTDHSQANTNQSSDNQQLRFQCVMTLDQYWPTEHRVGPSAYSPPPWPVFVNFEIISNWIEVFQLACDAQNGVKKQVQYSVISCFYKLGLAIQSQDGHRATSINDGPTNQIVVEFKRIHPERLGLFKAYAEDTVRSSTNPMVNQGLKFWIDMINDVQGEPTVQAPTTTNCQVPPNASSQALPADVDPQTSNTNVQSLVASSSQTPAASSCQVPAANTGSQAASATSASAITHTSTNPSSLASTPITQALASPVFRDEVRVRPRGFANDPTGSEGVLGEIPVARQLNQGEPELVANE